MDRDILYRIIESRRDVRAFRSDPVPEDALRRILGAAQAGTLLTERPRRTRGGTARTRTRRSCIFPSRGHEAI